MMSGIGRVRRQHGYGTSKYVFPIRSQQELIGKLGVFCDAVRSAMPPRAGLLRSALLEARSKSRPTNGDESNKLYQRHRWEVAGPNPL
jgi:hypothetical protein